MTLLWSRLSIPPIMSATVDQSPAGIEFRPNSVDFFEQVRLVSCSSTRSSQSCPNQKSFNTLSGTERICRPEPRQWLGRGGFACLRKAGRPRSRTRQLPSFLTGRVMSASALAIGLRFSPATRTPSSLARMQRSCDCGPQSGRRSINPSAGSNPDGCGCLHSSPVRWSSEM